ncbi:MAG: bifunctional tRNA (5-methylaminomethyl-2-thiouridine)(34)-methyltransferase MnmD/FAD-dependent 5-carboxymethylaminomethyl-2-thiouridine(34) oxidoreductase MnmC [Betaproteobacteria bacterium]|nr:bifunctional tRNA (5-methylaminomethyl-2-thiouridine)(34)-methyltransferase MnmD/FAD-dependent 5-carboxymethylaminomethyl-2-thiouridine(34) oxidoreductase MnmC [Betaproteobacteria bacterium]
MAQPLVPAALDFHDGVPYSAAFGDVYHSADGGLAQARHVFLAGNGLPRRWERRERFVVLETGFGLGLNFLATWRAWKEDPTRCSRLHFVSVEKHPFAVADLRTLHERYAELKNEAAQLHAAWPPLVPGAHRMEFERGAVVLTVFFSDVSIARDLRLQADAIYLDGFAPARNTEMWSHQTLRSIARLCASGATAATWSVASPVRAALEEVGFRVEKRPGFGSKREMLSAVYEKAGIHFEAPGERTATVVGAGLAGAAISERLCGRGWDVTLVERHPRPAQEASGNHAGAFHPIVTPDDSVFARLTRAAFLQASRTFSSLEGLKWDPCGVLQLARDEREDASQRRAVAALALPPDYAQLVTREEASRHAGVPLAAGGLWFPQAGWVQPPSLVNALLERCGSRLRRIYGKTLALREMPQGTVILATADDALCRVPHARLRRVRGQVTYVPEEAFEAPHAVCLRGGMVLPAVDGLCVAGASFDPDDDDPRPRAESDEGNLARVEKILLAKVEAKNLEHRVGFRVVAPDRLPLVGRIAGNVHGALALGSRGLIWASLAAEILAASLELEPMPIEGKLLDAIAPGRFAARARRREGSRAPRPSRP